MHQIRKKLLLLGSDNPTTWIVYNHLVQNFGLFEAIIERPIPRVRLIRNRLRKLGLIKVIDQLAFVIALRPLLLRRFNKRIREIARTQNLEMIRPISQAIHNIESVNSDECRALIANFKPDIIIVNGTRIIGKKTMQATNATFINTHHGITPVYRGAHGAYWALYQNDLPNCGVTIHLIDEGIDTGNIIHQTLISPTKADCFVTYPYLQTAAALPLLCQSIREASEGKLQTKPISGQSSIWYHPGLFQYLAGLWRGIV